MTAVTTEEDDFADFQAAPPTTTQPITSQSNGKIMKLFHLSENITC